MLSFGSARAQQCEPTGTNQTCTNSIFLSGGAIGLLDTATLTVTNTATGIISGISPDEARGISAVTANVTNSGTISGTATGGDIGFATGIFAATANVTNFATISGNGTGFDVGVGSGIVADIANVTNFATISGTGTAINDDRSSSGTGISTDIANVTNFGVISGTGTAAAISRGSGTGIIADITANVTNFGTISGTASAGNSSIGDAVGIQATLFQNTTANVTNFGTISGTGTGGNIGSGLGISAANANVTNHGTISGTGTGTVIGAGIGIIVGEQGTGTGNVTNYGTISGTGTTEGTGIHLQDGATSNVTNAGTIFGTTAAIQFAGNADTLTLLPGSTIIGAINLGGGGDTVNFRGGNHNLTFDTLADATVTGTTPFVVVGNRAVAVDATGFAMADRTLIDITGGISGMIANRFGPFGSEPRSGGAMVASHAPVYKAPVKARPVELYEPVTVVWAQGFGGLRKQPEDFPVLAARHDFAGGAIGFDRVVAPDLRLGAFAGGAWGKLDTELTVHDAESTYAFGGLYGRYDWRRSFFDFAVSVGHSRNDSERWINNNLVPNGIEIAKASYDGWFVSPEATFGWRLPLAGWAAPPAPFLSSLAVVPSAKVRYLAAWYDDYTETGSTANLTVDARSLQAFEGRLQLALTNAVVLPWGTLLRADIRVGAIGFARVGDEDVSAVLLGQGLAFAVPGEDQVSGFYWGGRLEAGLGPFAQLFAEAESITLSDDSRITTARGGIKVAF
jgi:hypothetical protein